jgi:DNA-directed RNA polymerase specialized sigma24 family protein
MMAAQGTEQLFHDRVLADKARSGDQQAYDELVHRLAPEAWRFAVAVARDRRVAAAALASAIGTTFGSSPASLATPNQSVRAQLLAAVRQAAADPALVPLDLDTTVGPNPGAVGLAFASLPERWRSALWLIEVEDVVAADAALALGVPVSGVEPLVARAGAGLVEQVIDVHADLAGDDACRRTLDRLSEYAAGRLPGRDEARIRRHLDACPQCWSVLAELDDLTPVLRSLALALPFEVLEEAERRWRASRVRAVGPLHLTLPSGRPVPAWAERTVAGAAAAIVALGISSAVLMAGRNGRTKDDGLARSVPTETPLSSGNGESALGGSSGLSGLLDGVTPSLPGASTGGIAPAAAEVVRPVVAPTAPAVAPVDVPAAPTPDPAAGSPDPAGPTTPPPPPPAPEPGAQVTVGLPGVATVTVGDQCTGIDLAGTVLGCAPPASEEPVQVDLGGSLLSGLGL